MFYRARRICSNNNMFNAQRKRINKILSWNGFPSYLRKKLLTQFSDAAEKRLQQQQQQQQQQASSTTEHTDQEIDSLLLKIPYMGAEGEKLVRKLKNKIQTNVSRKINIRIIYTTNKISKFCSVKDRIPEEQKNNVIYSFKCPGCGETYVGKTSCCFAKRLEEHGTRPDQPLHQHLSSCDEFRYLVELHNLPTSNSINRHRVNVEAHIYQTVKENSRVLMSSDDWRNLAFLEPLLAKKNRATINHGDKAMKSLWLF